MSDQKKVTKDWYTRVELTYPLHLSITHPDQHWAYPFVIDGHDGYVRLSLSQNDAIKVLRALMKTYPLEALASIE